MMSVSKNIRVAPHSFRPVVLKSPILKPCRIAKVARNLPQVFATNDQHNDVSKAAVLVPALSVAVPLLQADPALAIDREYGILEGQIFSLMHPAVMFFLFGATVYTGYLGLQWRRTRALAGEIKELKAQRVPVPANANEEGSEAPMPSSKDGVEAEISKLEAERKQLIGQRLNEKHNNWGSLLLGLGVLFSVSGGLNTFLRTGKLFPGPHLYAGAAITVLWALAAALVPAMQKGNDTARTLHITFNTLNLLLFVSQIPTGLEIVGKVLQFTTLP